MKLLSDRLLDLLKDGDIERATTQEDEDCIREAAALAKLYEDAPVRDFFISRCGYQVDSDAHGHCYELKHLNGQRVALVPLPQQSET